MTYAFASHTRTWYRKMSFGGPLDSKKTLIASYVAVSLTKFSARARSSSLKLSTSLSTSQWWRSSSTAFSITAVYHHCVSPPDFFSVARPPPLPSRSATTFSSLPSRTGVVTAVETLCTHAMSDLSRSRRWGMRALSSLHLLSQARSSPPATPPLCAPFPQDPPSLRCVLPNERVTKPRSRSKREKLHGQKRVCFGHGEFVICVRVS